MHVTTYQSITKQEHSALVSSPTFMQTRWESPNTYRKVIRAQTWLWEESGGLGMCLENYSSVHGILQARILEWVAISSSRGSFQPRDRSMSSASPALEGGFLATELPGKPLTENQHNPIEAGLLMALQK